MESAAGLVQLLMECDVDPESKCAGQLLQFLALLERWNNAVNLTAATDWPALKPLFREGILASKLYPAEAVSHLDIGSGAGFPAIILRLMIPHILLEMVESRKKKCVFLEKAGNLLGISGMQVHPARLDQFLRNCSPNRNWDCVTWKGLKLKRRDLLILSRHVHQRTQFWMFHGVEPAIEDPVLFHRLYQKLRSEEFTGKKGWGLSIYLPR
jgi:16S rRNA (guanine(527)-N(7))-methyltransferase RsmG